MDIEIVGLGLVKNTDQFKGVFFETVPLGQIDAAPILDEAFDLGAAAGQARQPEKGAFFLLFLQDGA